MLPKDDPFLRIIPLSAMGITMSRRPPDFGGRPVYVIDDDADLRRSLHFLLATRRADVGSFRNAIDFLGAVDGLTPSPMIVDVRMRKMNGLQLIAELTRRNVTWPAIFLSGHGDISIAVQALKLGASDFLEKPVVAKELETCIARAFEQLDSQTSEMETQAQASRTWALLTPRESAVLNHLCDGCSNKEVAFSLGISPRTVEMHRAKALRQLRAKNLPEAIKIRSVARQSSTARSATS